MKELKATVADVAQGVISTLVVSETKPTLPALEMSLLPAFTGYSWHLNFAVSKPE